MIRYLILSAVAQSASYLTTIVEVPLGILLLICLLILLPTEDLIELLRKVVAGMINPPRK